MALLENQRVGLRNDARRGSALHWMLLFALVVIAAVSITYLETARGDVRVVHTEYAKTPVTLFAPSGADRLIVVAHGFGGSRQMMTQIALPLAQRGFLVAAIDLPGHGRNTQPLSGDVTKISGTTEQLVQATIAATNAIAEDRGVSPFAVIGHSMASDVVIRASQRLPDVEKVVAISMYSEAVTADQPSALLILSGAFEGRLRAVAERAVHQVNADIGEGITANVGDVARRAVSVSGVGHVGVLYAPQTVEEIGAWLGAPGAASPRTGLMTLLLLGALVVLAVPVAQLLSAAQREEHRTLQGRVWPVLAVPMFVALPLAIVPMPEFLPGTGLLHLALIIAVWGSAQCIVLSRLGARWGAPDATATAVFMALGLACFALMLDRYGASFAPSGARWTLLLCLIPGGILLMAADSALRQMVQRWQVILARLLFLVTLVLAMAINPLGLGLAFTVVPVTILFFFVYGFIARCVERRRGRGSADIGLGVAYAWALACSTPVFYGATG